MVLYASVSAEIVLFKAVAWPVYLIYREVAAAAALIPVIFACVCDCNTLMAKKDLKRKSFVKIVTWLDFLDLFFILLHLFLLHLHLGFHNDVLVGGRQCDLHYLEVDDVGIGLVHCVIKLLGHGLNCSLKIQKNTYLPNCPSLGPITWSWIRTSGFQDNFSRLLHENRLVLQIG